MADIEHSIVSKILHSGGMAEVLRAGVTSAFFHDEEHGLIWDWMRDFWAKYGEEPTRDALRLEWPQYRTVKTPEPLKYYIDRLMAYDERYGTVELVSEAAEYVKEDDYKGALRLMSDGVLEIAKRTAQTEDEDVISTAEDRMGRWQAIEDSNGQGLVGIPTGFPFIDRATGGLQPEQWIVFIGPPKSGKSSLALKMAIEANNAGNSVMFETFEMSNLEQEARHDAIRAGFNPNLLLQGRATEKQKAKLRRELNRIKNHPPLYFIHDMGARTLSSTIAKIHQYKPDLVIIDGLWLMDAEVPGADMIDTKALTKISRSFKVLAQERKIPIIGTMQVLDWKWSAKKGLQTSSVGYSSAFGQDCDLMLGIEPPESDDDPLRKLRIVEGRNVGRQYAQIRYDWDTGTIEEVELDGGGDDEDDEDKGPG